MRIREAAARLAAAGVPSPDHDAAVLVAHATGVDVAEARQRDVLGRVPDRAQQQALDDLLDQRAARVPLQHLTGTAGFRGLELRVGPGVFVPRPETELLVDLAADGAPEGSVVVDLCTGSGAIAFALADERPDLTVHAVELDPHAWAWAEHNRARLAPAVDLRQGDATMAFDDLLGHVDVVVSNPPYIPEDMEPVDPEVALHDPRVALYGGSADGLAIPLRVAARASELLRAGGLLVMEHAEAQGGSLPRALTAAGWRDVEDRDDLTGRPRAVLARR